MTILDAIIQGIVQGLTEFLPVSSSGHLAITQHILGVSGEGNLFFNVMLHIGTLVAVVAFYHKLFWNLIKEFFRMIGDIFTGKFRWREMNYERNLIVMLIIGLIPLFLLFIPIPGTDMKVKDLADVFSASPILIVTAVSLCITSALLFIGIICNKRNSQRVFRHLKGSSADSKGRETYTVFDAVCVGLMQCVAALFPGVSRSGSTLAVGEMRGINKQKALDYTFVLGTPAIILSNDSIHRLSHLGSVFLRCITFVICLNRRIGCKGSCRFIPRSGVRHHYASQPERYNRSKSEFVKASYQFRSPHI